MCPHGSSEGEGLKKKDSPFGGDLEGANCYARNCNTKNAA